MKVLLLVTDLVSGTGGIKAFNNNLVKALLDLGHTICVISINDTERPVDREYFFYCSGKYLILKKPTFVANILKQIPNFKPDIVFCGHVNFSPMCMVLFNILKVPYFTITHGIDVWNLNRIKLLGLKSSSKILSVSRFTREKILRQLPEYIKENLIILPNTVDSERFRPSPKPRYLLDKWKIRNDDKVILTIARLSGAEKYKGYDKVIMALKDIIKETPNIKYVIGGSGDDMDRIEKLIINNSLEEKVILPGFIPEEELVDYYNLCDIFIMPSTGEGFGIVFLEALACGKPVIGGDKDGSVDAIMDGKLGILVDPAYIDHIKDAIFGILKGAISEQLIDAKYLRQRVTQVYGFEKFKERLKTLMESKNHE